MTWGPLRLLIHHRSGGQMTTIGAHKVLRTKYQIKQPSDDEECVIYAAIHAASYR
jgi:hypothetical protein